MNEQLSRGRSVRRTEDSARHGSCGIDADAGPPDLDQATEFIVRHWVLISVAAVVGAAIAFGGSYLLPKRYRAEVLIAPVSAQSNSPLRSLVGQYGTVAGLAGIDLEKDDSATVEAVAMLKSRAFIEQFISEEKIMPLLFPKLWDARTSSWRVSRGQAFPTLQEGQRQFVKKVLRVAQDKDTRLITVSVEWRDPIEAAQWANGLVARVNEAARTRAITTSERSINFLARELEHTQAVEIRQSIFSLLQTQVNKRMLANTRPDFAFSVIDPAQAPDRNRYIWPVPLLFGALGLFAGALLGLVSTAVAPHLPGRWRRATSG